MPNVPCSKAELLSLFLLRPSCGQFCFFIICILNCPSLNISFVLAKINILRKISCM